ncbi:DUF4139 domain-containing protein [Pyrococcus abyssi]|nr:hypothetical protein [Pyrococcus abyssi]CCE69680.1 TPA: hypothetical protein PAB0206 [Pyrococcus abyssi GE5]
MKRKLIGIPLVLIFLGVLAFYTSAESEDNEVFFYNSFAMVERTITLELDKGYNEVPIEEITGDNSFGIPLIVSGDVSLVGIRGEYRSYIFGIPVGSEVIVTLKSKVQISGILRGLQDNYLVVERGSQKVLINPGEISYISVSKSSRESNSVILYADEAGRHNITLIYRVENVKWSSTYRLILKDEEGVLEGLAIIENPSKARLKGKGYLVSGDIGGTYPVYLAMTKQEAQGERYIKEEHITLFPIGNVEVNGESKVAIKFLTESLEWERSYLYESWPYQEEGPIYEVIRFKTDKPLPPGNVEVYREEDGKLILIRLSSIQQKASGDYVEIKLGREYELKGTTKVIQRVKEGDKTKYKVEITIENLGNEPREVMIKHHKIGRITYSSLNPIEETADYVILEVKVNPGGKEVVNLEYET